VPVRLQADDDEAVMTMLIVAAHVAEAMKHR
jgi:hypothetical protein